MSETNWAGLVKGMLKAEIKRRNMTYEHLSAKLAEMGVYETPTNLRTKISRGGFSAVFFVQCLLISTCMLNCIRLALPSASFLSVLPPCKYSMPANADL